MQVQEAATAVTIRMLYSSTCLHIMSAHAVSRALRHARSSDWKLRIKKRSCGGVGGGFCDAAAVMHGACRSSSFL